MINMDNVSSSGPLNDPDEPFPSRDDLMWNLLRVFTNKLKDLEARLEKLEAPPESDHSQSLATCTKMMSDTYTYIWACDDKGALPAFYYVEVDIRYVYTAAIPPITTGPPDAWVEGVSATLTIDSWELEGNDLEFAKHLEENEEEIKLEIIESIEADLTDS